MSAMKTIPTKKWLPALVVILLLVPSNAFADSDVGQIAVIEDTTGLILPAGGMCDNMLFAQGLCVNHAAQAFYANHPDNYDILVFFTPKVLGMLFDVKMGFPVQVAAEGIGLESVSLFNPSQFGSSERLRQCVKMGSLPDLPNDPGGLYTMPPITGIELLAHEIGHQWLCWILVDHDDGRGPIPILRGWENNSPNGHWSCWFHNHGSVMYGGNLADNGDGSFTDTGGTRKYSPLDQYLMGLRTADEVEDMWYVDVDGTTEGCPSMPMGPGTEWTHQGTRVDFPIEDIIRANGARVPESSPCHLKVGFVLVHPAGSPPTTAEIEKTERYRTALEAWWAEASDERGSLDTRLDGCGTGTSACPGDVSSQCGAMPDGDTDGDDDEAQPDGDESCEFNDFRCNAQGQVEICNPNGQWQWLENCTNGQICRDGGCVADADGDTDGDMSNPDGDTSADGDDSHPDGDDATDGDDPGLSDGDAAFPNPDGDDPQAGQSGGSGGGCVQARGSFASFAWIALLLLLRNRRKRGARP